MRADHPDRRLHILQVIHSMGIGGTERVVRDLAREFNGETFRTSVCCLDSVGEFGDALRREGVTVNLVGRRAGVDVRLVWRLRQLYARLGVDVVHAHQYTPYVYAAAACLLAPQVKVVFTEHGRHQPDRLRLRRAASNQILRLVTAAYTGVSAFTRESLVAFERIPRSRIRVIYNGVERPVEPGPSVATARGKLGLDASVPIVLAVGRMDRIKDFGTLVRAFGTVVRDVPDAVLLVAGDGDRAYVTELRSLSESLDLNGRVRFLGNRSDIPDLLTACDVFALTSVSEAACMTILEGMAAGRPVVATAAGGNAELVVDGQTGVLVPVGDAGAVATALVRLLRDPEQARRMGAAGRRRVAERFSMTTALAAYQRLYEDAVRP